MTFNIASFNFFSTAKFAVLLGLFFLTGVIGISAQKSDQPVAADKYNRQPLINFKDRLVLLQEAKKDLYKPFEYSLEGTIDDNGKLIASEIPRFTGDPKSQTIVKGAVEAISDSGMLKLLSDLKSKKVKILITQDGSQFKVGMTSIQESVRETRMVLNIWRTVFDLSKVLISKNIDEDPPNKDEQQMALELLNLVNVKSEGLNVILDLIVPNTFVETALGKL